MAAAIALMVTGSLTQNSMTTALTGTGRSPPSPP